MKPSSIYTILILATALPLQAQEKRKAPKEPASAAKQVSVTQEPLGGLALGQKPAEVVKLLGKPESKGKKQMQEATGSSVQDWNYPAKGLKITMEFIGENESVHMVHATAACTLATARGIKIGSAESSVKKAYAKERSKDGSKDGESLLAGSPYDGLEFTFKDGKVTEIFLGVTAE